MKLSLAWIFDHIDTGTESWQAFDVEMIAKRFNEVTAEIEHVHHVSFDLSNFFLVFEQDGNFFLDEGGEKVSLSPRSGFELLSDDSADRAYLVKKSGNSYSWATLKDFYDDKDGLVPAIHAPQSIRNGVWRSLMPDKAVILEVDNKSITHRPDMWSHRGFAREIAPFVGKKLKSSSQFLRDYPISDGTDFDFKIFNEEPSLCNAFNGLHVPKVSNRACDIKILGRLITVGARPLNALVDITNYIALDWGQPVHAYDAAKIEGRTVKIRKAHTGEQLALLDGNTITLTTEDLVIADAKKPMCLAGVKGGVEDSVSAKTTAIFFEAASFNAGSVRKSALRHKTRTDSSARFEKTLDPNLAQEAVHRFLKLMDDVQLPYTSDSAMISVGIVAQPKKIVVEHAFLEARMGLELKPDHVCTLLQSVEFGVTYDAKNALYDVTIPTFRASKDVSTREDILEEVVRTYGFAKIPLVMPRILRRPFTLNVTTRARTIKHFLAHSAGMTEIQNYSFLDEAFLKSIDLVLESAAKLVNPVSENFCRLLPSLVPNLLKNIVENHLHKNELRFFESARTWHVGVAEKVEERKSLAACWFFKRAKSDFYMAKMEIMGLLEALGYEQASITWKQVVAPVESWYRPYQTAEIFVGETKVGTLGCANPLLLARLGMAEVVDAIFAELDVEMLISMDIPAKRFKQISCFQDSFLDFSFMVPLAVTTATLEHELQAASVLVRRVELIDFFEKEGWDNQRSLTFRVWIMNSEGTLDKAMMDQVWEGAVKRTKGLGVELRAA